MTIQDVVSEVTANVVYSRGKLMQKIHHCQYISWSSEITSLLRQFPKTDWYNLINLRSKWKNGLCFNYLIQCKWHSDQWEKNALPTVIYTKTFHLLKRVSWSKHLEGPARLHIKSHYCFKYFHSNALECIISSWYLFPNIYTLVGLHIAGILPLTSKFHRDEIFDFLKAQTTT